MKISVMVPCFNEEENVVPISQAIISQFTEHLPKYDYELLFIDNCSTDRTRELLEGLCAKNKKIKAIFNARNFGQFNSPFYGACQTTGDCTITMCCDFQDPPEMIPELVAKWEQGYKVVCAVKKTSKENKFVRGLRSLYYKFIKKHSDVQQIEHYFGTGLYDKSFIEVWRNLDDPSPFLRGVVNELGFKITTVEFEQQKRRAGKTHNNFSTLYDAAMQSFTTYTKYPIRFITFWGVLFSILGFLGTLTCIILHFGRIYPMKSYLPVAVIVMFGGFILASIGLIGEYLITVKSKVIHRPLVIEEKRINFDDDQKQK